MLSRLGMKNLAILVLVVIALIAAGIGWLVHSNNVQSKATHEQFAAAESAYKKADTSYKEAAQKLKTAVVQNMEIMQIIWTVVSDRRAFTRVWNAR